MKNDPGRHVETLFHACRSRAAGAERQAYLDGACGDNADLRSRVEALLAAHDEVSDFLEDPAVSSPQEGPGSSIGAYKILQQIGEGGMGVVYMAEQQEPVRRKVALKVIKLGMDTKQVIARFEAERQALAMMDHPSVARVFDAGTTERERPYFVMEYVQGVPITRHCDQHCLTTRQRLELFVQVCHGVQHAHQKAIIHRDLKPSNETGNRGQIYFLAATRWDRIVGVAPSYILSPASPRSSAMPRTARVVLPEHPHHVINGPGGRIRADSTGGSARATER